MISKSLKKEIKGIVLRPNKLIPSPFDYFGKVDILEKTQPSHQDLKQKIEAIPAGESPTDEHLIELIQSVLPEPVPGHTPTNKELLALIKPLIQIPKDGETPSDERLLTLIKPLISQPKKVEILPKEIADKLSTLEGVLSVNLFHDLVETIQKYIPRQLPGGGRGPVYHDSSLTGSGMSYDPLKVATAGGINFESPVTGLINSSNVTFTFLNTPKAIVLNGRTYFEGEGYTLSSLTVTMLVVPITNSTLKSIY